MSAFIFDMDGVLFANSDFHIEAWIVYARKFGREITEEDVRSRLGWNNRDYMRFVFNREPTDEEVEHSVFDKEEVYRNICREHLVHPDGLLTFLEAAQAAGIKMGVATSAPTENVRFTLDGLDIRKYFEVVVDATQVKKSKPDPAIYLKAAEQLAEVVARHQAGDAHRQHARDLGGGIGGLHPQRVGHRADHLARTHQEAVALRRQRHALGAAHEQRAADLGFQLQQALGQRTLRDAEHA